MFIDLLGLTLSLIIIYFLYMAHVAMRNYHYFTQQRIDLIMKIFEAHRKEIEKKLEEAERNG